MSVLRKEETPASTLPTGKGEFARSVNEGARAAAAAEPVTPRSVSRATLTQAAIIAMGVIASIAALYFARSILMPVLAALVIGLVLHPVQSLADRFKVPPLLTALLLVGVFFAVLYTLASLVLGPVTTWVAQAPELGTLIKEKFRWLDGPLATWRELKKSVSDTTGPSAPTVAVEISPATLLQQALTILTPAVSEFLVFFGTLLFFLVGYGRLRRQLITHFETRLARLRVVRIWNEIEHDLITYLGTVTFINLGLGIVTTAMLYALGFPSPPTFGVLAFVLNYIPYIGPAIVVVTLFAAGLIVTPSFDAAILPPILFVAVATVEGHFITPSIVGRRLTLSPFLVFLALAFWTWLWGPLGAFMATPLLIVGLAIVAHLFPREEKALP